jgi:CDP-diacylglycerol--glycerol-3-phosphate 3-phosphatidyltransferase
MLNTFARSSVSRVTDPIGAWLLRRGVTPDLVTVIGATGTVAAALWFFPRGQLLAGTFVIWAFVMFDLLDGAVARARGFGTRFGTVLDATGDRLADGAVYGALTWWAFGPGARPELAVAALTCLVSAQVVSYIKARAEATGLSAGGGVMERAERYLVTLLGTGLTGIGLAWAIDVALWLVAVLSLITIGQRVVAVWHSARELG